MTGWQLIESAPRTGHVIWLAGQHSMRLGFWREGEQYEIHGSKGGGWADLARSEGGGPNDLTFAPTHWQHVPEPPPR